MKRSRLALLLPGALALGCYQAHYVNFSPQNPLRGGAPAASTPADAPVKTGNSWRSFFLFGWAPGELRIDAAGECGGADRVDSIRTQQTFAQGVVASLAGYYINIYSPYDAAIYCKQSPPAPPAVPVTPAAPPAPEAAPE